MGDIRRLGASPCRSCARLGADAQGAVAVLLALVLGALVAVLALAVELGRAWNLETELQHAADAGALAGATQLDGTDGARARAIAAVVSEIARNRQSFASDGLGAEVLFDADDTLDPGTGLARNRDIRFYSRLPASAAHEATSDAEARFVEVAVAPRRVDFAFAAVLAAVASVSPRARAVAGRSVFVCGEVALAICNPDEPSPADLGFGVAAPFDAQSRRGRGVTFRASGQAGALAPANFAWLTRTDCNDPDDRTNCSMVESAGELAERLARIVAPSACLAEAVQAQPAEIEATRTYLDMRLDIYPETASGYDADPLYQPSPHYLSGLVPAPGVVTSDPVTGAESMAACDFTAGSGATPDALEPPQSPFLGPDRHALQADGTFDPPIEHMGYPRDNCAYLDASGEPPADNCIFAPSAGVAQGTQLGTGRWDLPTYLAHHHPGVVADLAADNACPSSGCRIGSDAGAAVDLDGSGTISRWEMYRWELRHALPVFRRPQCFERAVPEPPMGPAEPDRRLLGVAVINCNAIAAVGGSLAAGDPLPLAGAAPIANVILSEAVGELAPDSFYVEIVGPASTAGASAVALHERIVLYE